MTRFGFYAARLTNIGAGERESKLISLAGKKMQIKGLSVCSLAFLGPMFQVLADTSLSDRMECSSTSGIMSSS